MRVSLQRLAKIGDSDEKVLIIVSNGNYSARKDFLVAKKVISQQDFDLNHPGTSPESCLITNKPTRLTSESGYATILIGL